MFRRLPLILKVALFSATIAYAGLMVAGSRQPVEWSLPVRGNWLLIQLSAGLLRVHLFTPEDPSAIDMLRGVSAVPKQTIQRGPYRETLPHMEMMHAAVFVEIPDWAWGSGVNASALLWCGAGQVIPNVPPSVFSNVGPNRNPNVGPDYAIEGTVSYFIVPPGVVILPLAAYPVWATLWFLKRKIIQRYRRRRGLCLRCGYNLTGLPQPRCPECGTEFTLAERAENAP